jgi:C4-type Zn-finger protein
MAYDDNVKKPIIDGKCWVCGGAFEYVDVNCQSIPLKGDTSTEALLCDACLTYYSEYHEDTDSYTIDLQWARAENERENND